MRRSSMLRLGDRTVINFAHLITAKKMGGGDLLDLHLRGHVLHLDGPDVEPCWGFLRHLAVMPIQTRDHHIEFIGDQVFDLARLLVAHRRPDSTPGVAYEATEVELNFLGGHSEMVRGENATRIWAALRDLATVPPAPKEGER